MATVKNYTASVGTIQTTVANNGTITVPYPAGTTQATFAGGAFSGLGTVITAKNNVYKESAGACSFSYGASNITITNTSGYPWSAGDTLDYGIGGANTQAYNYSGTATASFGTLTAAAGMPVVAAGGTTTVPDVGAAFSQATLNNIVATLVAAINANSAALKSAGITF